jgi:hypothetical protein
MAMVNPMGNATPMAITVVNRVPVRSGKMPKCLLSNKGVHLVPVINSQTETSLKKLTDSDTNTQRIARVVTMVRDALHFNTPSINISEVFLLMVINAKPQSEILQQLIVSFPFEV